LVTLSSIQTKLPFVCLNCSNNYFRFSNKWLFTGSWEVDNTGR